MIPILRAGQMKNCDSKTIEEIGVPAIVLMERAALSIARAVKEKAGADPLILAVCGSGNNGGDGAAAVRILDEEGYRCGIVFAGDPDRVTPEMRIQLSAAEKLHIPVYSPGDAPKPDIVIDALLGCGLKRAVEGGLAEAVRWINESGAYVVAADIPTGIGSDTGQVLGCAVRADETVAVQCLKPGHLLYPGAAYAGHITTANAGIRVPGNTEIAAFTKEDLRMCIPERYEGGHKGTFGKVAVAAGSFGMSGAAVLCARAVLRSGAGMVRVVTEECNRQILQTALPEAMVSTYTDPESAAEAFAAAIAWADCAAAGPGIGQGENAKALVQTALAADIPLVLDADGITLCTERDLAGRKELCLTPHLMEMQKLTGIPVGEIREDLIRASCGLSERTGASVILKDARSVIAEQGRVYINTSGNSGMATAGSGDVLTGILAALKARKTEHAAAAAAFLHGLAGDRAASLCGASGVMAGDIADAVPYCLSEIGR